MVNERPAWAYNSACLSITPFVYFAAREIRQLAADCKRAYTTPALMRPRLTRAGLYKIPQLCQSCQLQDPIAQSEISEEQNFDEWLLLRLTISLAIWLTCTLATNVYSLCFLE